MAAVVASLSLREMLVTYVLHNVVVGWVIPVLGAVVVRHRPHNAVGWVLVIGGSANAIVGGSTALLAFATANDWAYSWHVATAYMVTACGWVPGALGVVLFVPLLFPDGKLPSPRWRPVLWAGVLGTAIATAGFAVPGWQTRGVALQNLESELGPPGWTFVGFILIVAALLAGIGGLVVRFRRGSREERDQIKLVAFALALATAILVPATVVANPLFGAASNLVVLPLIPAAIAVAIVRHRLFGIDVVINRTVVFAGLGAFITLVYVAIVVGVGRLLGAGSGNRALAIAATAVVAVAFQPVRERVQRLANRLVYGARSNPYETLARFSSRVAETYDVDDVLPRVARVLADATGATQADVWVTVGNSLFRAAAYPDDVSTARSIPLGAGGALPDAFPGQYVAPVRHGGDLLGALTVTEPPGVVLSPEERRLVDDLARQAGLVLRNVLLTEQLKAKVEEIAERASELRASRERIVTAQDAERRRMERDIHDGAQQHLVALAVKLRLVKALVQRDPPRAKSMLDELRHEVGDALDSLRNLARGIYPALLSDQGLALALRAHAERLMLPVRVVDDGVARYAPEVENAVYFCCLEALQNISKYANATQSTITLAERDGVLHFEVSDDGRGFDPAKARRGAGLQNMADRMAALGGSVAIESEPGTGTTVTGRVPARAMEPVA